MKRLFFSLIIFWISTIGYSQSIPNTWFPTTGSANTYTTNIIGFGSSYTNKMAFLKFHVTNTTASTVNIAPTGGSAIGAASIRKWNGSSWVALSSGDLRTDIIYKLTYDNVNTWFQLEIIGGTGGGGIGTVTDFSVVTANGVSASVSNSTTTPAATFTLGAITPISVNGIVFSGSSTPTLAVTGTSTISGTNTGNEASASSSVSGISKLYTSTGANTDGSMDQNSITAGLAGKQTTTLSAAHILVGNGSNLATDIAVSGDGSLSSGGVLTITKLNGTSLAGLGTGILKNTTGTGVPSIAGGADLPVMTATVGGAVPTPPNNTTTFLRGDGTFATPAGSGTVNAGAANQLAYYATSTSAVSGLTAITANRVLVSNGSGLPIASITTDTEISYVSGVTSAIQTQLTGKQSTITFGTGIQTALGVNIGSAGAPILFNGAAGTPTSINVSNATGFPTLNQNTTGSAASLTTPRTIGIITGDGSSTGSSFDGTGNNTNAFTLATVNSNVGSFASATQVGTFTVNGKGLITAAGNTTITPAIGSITGLGSNVATYLATPTTANLSATIGTQTANTGFFGPSSGSAANATFRAQVTADLPFDTYTTQSGTTYTLVAADKNTCIRFTSSSAVTITLPNGITSGFSCVIIKSGTGDLTLSAATTLEGATTVTGTAPSFAVVKNRGSDIWVTNGSFASVTTIGTFDGQTVSSNGGTIAGNSIYFQSADLTHPGLINTTTQTFAGTKTLDGSFILKSVGQYFSIKEGTNGMMGQVALVSGTKAITVSGVTTSSRCFPALASQGGTVSTTIAYECSCTSNTVTINAVTNAGGNTVNTLDTSTINYILYQPAP